jgi:hypothetical protein
VRQRVLNDWQPEHVARLEQLAAKELSSGAIARILSEEFGVPRSRNSIIGRADRTGGQLRVGDMQRRFFVDGEFGGLGAFLRAGTLGGLFFLRTFLTLAIIGFLSLQTSLKRTSNKHDFAMFMISAVLLSTSTASYTFILLILPIVLLLEESGPMESVFLVLSYVLLTLPLHPTWLFPKAWLLISLFLVVSWSSLRRISLRTALVVTGVVSILSIVDANRHMLSYANEPAQHFAHAVVQEGAIFSSFPVISRYGLFYQSMRNDRYVLRWLHGNHNEELSFNGQSFHPRVASNGESILFELVANGTSTMMQFDPSTRKTEPSTTAVLIDPIVSIVSPDGKWMTYESSADGPVQIWIREMAGGRMRQLTGGNCNNSSPTWELDSHSIIFASDCNRAFGLPALYRSPIDDSTFK